MTNAKVLTLFNFNSNDIRVIDINNEPWFPLRDVCDLLGIMQAPDAKKRLKDSEHQYVRQSNVATNNISFPNRGMTFVLN